MIYKLKSAAVTEFATAKNHLHLLQSYDTEFGGFQDIEEVEEISDEDAKKIMILNTEYSKNDKESLPKEISLYDLSCGDDFEIIASTEW